MENKMNDQERMRYDGLIVEKENQVDKLHYQKRKIEVSVRHLEEDLHTGFQTLRRLQDETARFDESKNSWMQVGNEEQERTFHQLLRESNEQIEIAYQKK